MLIAGFGMALVIAPLAAAADDHLTEAISLTRRAIKHGMQGQAEPSAQDAEAAYKAAAAAAKDRDNPETKRSMTCLAAVIFHAKHKKLDVAIKFAQEAAGHLANARCSRIEDTFERLTCFDNTNRPVETPNL
jgi:hypothetical protein